MQLYTTLYSQLLLYSLYRLYHLYYQILHCAATTGAILFFSSSKILTSHPSLCPASVSSPGNKGGGYTLAGRRGGWGVNILEDERDRIALLQ